MFILKCALKLVEEIILYYDARSKKHQIACNINYIKQCNCRKEITLAYNMKVHKTGKFSNKTKFYFL